jgi:hypothetical protein
MASETIKEPGWLKRQQDEALAELGDWPDWMIRQAGLHEIVGRKKWEAKQADKSDVTFADLFDLGDDLINWRRSNPVDLTHGLTIHHSKTKPVDIINFSVQKPALAERLTIVRTRLSVPHFDPIWHAEAENPQARSALFQRLLTDIDPTDLSFADRRLAFSMVWISYLATRNS